MKVLPDRAPFSLNSWYISWYTSLISGTYVWYVTHIFRTELIFLVRVPEIIRVPEKMVAVPEKWDVYHIVYRYFQYTTKYVPEKAVRVPTDLIAYNSAYRHYQLVYRKFWLEIAVFWYTLLYTTGNIGT